MRYKLLGKSGLRVSELCLGAMTFGEDWGSMLPGASKEEAKKIFDLIVSKGGNFIDTANVYQDGTSEKYVGEFVSAEREKFVLATKYTLTTNPNDPNASGNHRKNLVQSLEASLKRLNTRYIDLLWVHIWDPLTPIEELVRSLDDLIRSGKVLYLGISDSPAWVVSHANAIADLRGWSSFIGIQIMYSLIERSAERELLPMARALDIGVTARSPLGGGVLSGKYIKQDSKEQKRFDVNNPMSASFVNERTVSIATEVQTIANEMNRTPSQIALNWIRQQHDRGIIIPIVGARTEAQIKDNSACLDFELTADQLRRLDEKSKIQLGFPHDFISEAARIFTYGNTFSLTDNHRP
ncbi:MAG: aldo/keto reductase [Candidatus Nitrosopolaris wilkensis]|nr:MAG: aldo/keto reductase [Candidatus Nitrosopolaris wilkensis]